MKSPLVRRADRVSRTKVAHLLRVTHRDEIEAPITDWLREAYEFGGEPAPAVTRIAGGGSARQSSEAAPPRKRAAKKR